MCIYKRVRKRKAKGEDMFCWNLQRIVGMSTPCNGENFQISLKRVRRIMVVVFLSPLHSTRIRKHFRTWLSKTEVTMKKKTVMVMIQMVTWGDLINYYFACDWFMEIWGFKKEENFSLYKVLDKTVREWLDKTNNCPYICGPDRRKPIERRGDTIIRDIYITRNKFNMTTRALSPHTGA